MERESNPFPLSIKGQGHQVIYCKEWFLYEILSFDTLLLHFTYICKSLYDLLMIPIGVFF